MDIRFVTAGGGDVVAVMATEAGELLDAGKALDAAANGRIAKAMKAARFTGAAGQVADILAPEGIDFGRVLVIGLGKPDAANGMTVERWAGHAVKRTLTSGAEKLVLQPDALPTVSKAEAGAHAAMGARLAAYRFDTYKTKLKPEQKPTLQAVEIMMDGTAAAKARAEKDSAIVEGVFFARDLVSEPPNVLYPESFAERLRDLETLGVEVDLIEPAQMERLGMGALLGVAQGSAHPARLVAMKWNGAATKKGKPLALVGKGVTFDTGGISLKPGAGMDEMKGDMGGAAAVAGVMKAVALRKAKANVVGVVALVENMPGANAQRPGDIVNTMSGQTIEVLNTDAEGRLILADAVWYAQDKFDPAAVIDLATLTGAVIVALGHEHAGLFSSDEDLAHAITAAAQTEGESVWRLPLSPAYDKLIDTPNADMKNIAGKPMAGSIVGAQFIKRFIKEGVPWAHLDIAGTAWKPAPYEDPISPTWATGYGVRLLNRLIANRYED
ncbi:MAG: leucyl aminopeptidase [Hyphomonadaceae bacterium]|nr:leucyl aminopeptidase [Hyphomonadaceae bacterium]GIK49541.1 MAG: putative cytosol aminopeptidase [Alphaproteobacteria bacterium]